MKTYDGDEVQLLVCFTHVLDGGKCSASLPDPFTPGKMPSVAIGF
jgi:hypothetical protein